MTFEILGVMFHNILLRGTCIPFLLQLLKRLVHLKNLLRVLEDQDVLLRCFISDIFPCLEYCSPVWYSVADSHLKILYENL